MLIRKSKIKNPLMLTSYKIRQNFKLRSKCFLFLQSNMHFKFPVHMMEELQDYICIGQDNIHGEQRVILFVKLKPKYKFSPEFAKKVQKQVLNQLTEEHVPAIVLEAKDIPVRFKNIQIYNEFIILMHLTVLKRS